MTTPDRPIKYLSRQYLKVHACGRRGFKVRLPQEYFDSIATAIEMVGCASRAVPGRKKSGPTVGQVGQEQRMLGASDHSRYRAGVGKLQFMINQVPEIVYAVKNLSRQLAGPSELDMRDLKQCVRYTLVTQRRVVVPDGARQTSEDRRCGNDRRLQTREVDEIDVISAHEDRWIHHWGKRTAAGHAPLRAAEKASSARSEQDAHVKAILDDLGMQANLNLRCDAKAARALAQRQGMSKRTRHVKVKYLYVQNLVKAREVEVSADMGTKYVPSHRLEFPQELDGKELRERDDVPIGQYRTIQWI